MIPQERLRKMVEDIRRKPIPIKDIIPILQEVADKLDSLQNRIDWLEDRVSDHEHRG